MGRFHPPEAVAALRTVMRHRVSLVHMASSHVQHAHKALTQMNLQIASSCLVLDLTGTCGSSTVLRYGYRSRGWSVTVVTVSPKYQVVIPKDVRDKLNIRPGQKVEAFAIGTRIELVPVEPIERFRGRYPNLPPLEREPDRL